MKYQKQILTLVAVFVILILVYVVVVVQYIPLSEQNANSLAIGSQAIVESLSVPVVDNIDLDNMSRDQIYDLRKQAVMEYPWLIYTKYNPSNGVFGKIKGELSWWGNAGWYYYGKGEKSASGLSKESLLILNPYLLVSADFSGLSSRSAEKGENFWNGVISSAALEKKTFPYYVVPENLRWWPERSRIEVTYDLTGYLPELNYWMAKPAGVANTVFDLIAYNARDLNMNYILVDYKQSLNITKENPPSDAAAIIQRLQTGNECGLPGGCNDFGGAMPELQGLQLKSVPAKLIVYLWSAKPSSAAETPDITYVINIK